MSDNTLNVLRELIDCLLDADTASGYCQVCEQRTTGHRTQDHMPVDSGDYKATQAITHARMLIAELEGQVA